MLELAGVTARYGEVMALRGLHLTVGRGETLALIGRNGAGKTTTLGLAAGSVAPAVGDIRWDGSSIAHLSPEERIKLGIVLVPEGRGVFPGLTVDENLRIGAFWRRAKGADLRRSLDEVYGRLPRLAERRRQMGGSLSGGEQQMLALGRALMSRPQLLMMDEPSLGLSPLMVESLYALLAELKSDGLGFILVEQYVPLALKLCDRALGLKKGTVAISGSAASVAQKELTEVYMAAGTAAGETA
jgi:branched-chain amino acid transport system ATP-binding protein